MDPRLIEHPEEAGKIYRDITQQRYLLSKHMHTSYIDTLHITPLERQYLFEFITEQLEKEKASYEKAVENNGDRRR